MYFILNRIILIRIIKEPVPLAASVAMKGVLTPPRSLTAKLWVQYAAVHIECVVVGKIDKFIHVKFTLGEKKFVFPDAFLQGFLEVR